MNTYHITWWNLENLFDIEHSRQRPDYLQSQLRSELERWDRSVLNKKLSRLASIIVQLNAGAGPDVLGVCEVENRSVLEDLVRKLAPLNRNYGIAHHDMNDKRGIDVAFIYDKDMFTFEQYFSYEVLKRSATRDIFQVNLRTVAGRGLIVIGNHWPSRSGGQYESEPYRIMAAETLSYWMKRIFEIRGNSIPVLVMGDFNDECFDRSLTDYALSTISVQKVKNARAPRLYNLMGPVIGLGTGTHYYNNFPNVLDQFLASRSLLLQTTPIRLKPFADGTHAKVEMFPEMVSGGNYPDPIRFGRPSSGEYNPDSGFSDHYPISTLLVER